MKYQILLFTIALIAASSEARELNTKSLNLIKEFEGWRSCAYKDPVGKLTIGYGHLVKAGESYKLGTCITQTAGTQLLRKDVATAANCISRNVKGVTLNNNEFGALSSWAYNVGCGNVASSTLVKQLNAGNKAGVCTQLERWNKASGQVLPGLVRRRKAECALFKSA